MAGPVVFEPTPGSTATVRTLLAPTPPSASTAWTLSDRFPVPVGASVTVEPLSPARSWEPLYQRIANGPVPPDTVTTNVAGTPTRTVADGSDAASDRERTSWIGIAALDAFTTAPAASETETCAVTVPTLVAEAATGPAQLPGAGNSPGRVQLHRYGGVPPSITVENVSDPPTSAPATDGTTVTLSAGETTRTAGGETISSPRLSRTVATGRLTPAVIGRQVTTGPNVPPHPSGSPDQVKL